MAKLFRLDGNLSTRGTEMKRVPDLGFFYVKNLLKNMAEEYGLKVKKEGSTFKLLLPLDVQKPFLSLKSFYSDKRMIN